MDNRRNASLLARYDYLPLSTPLLPPLSIPTDMETQRASEQELASLNMMLDSIKAGMIRLGTKGQYSAYRAGAEQIRLLFNRVGKTYNDESRLHKAR